MSKRVGPTGPKDADVVIVGEAPGKTEVSQGEPFVGRSGKLLTKLLHSAGILRDHCYITNVIKEKAPGNDVSGFINPPKVTDKGERYIRSFENELRKLDPNLIIPVGNIPLYVLTGKQGITKWRGSILQGNYGHKVIPTIHPAAALRYYIQRYYILMDLRKAADEMDSPKLDRKERTYITGPNMKETMTYLNDCLGKDLVAFDIEVNSNKEVSCLSFSYDESHAISIPFIGKKGELYFKKEEEKEVWLKIAEVLEDQDTRIVAHNAMFDTNFLYRKYGIATKNIEDTMIAAGLLYPDFDKDLGFLTAQYTDIPYYKDENKTSFKAQHTEQFWLYNAKDSIVLSETFPQQLEELRSQDNIEVYKSQRDLIEPLLFMTEHGMEMDIEALRNERDRLEEEIEGLERDLMEVTGRAINPRSVPQLKEYFYEHKGIKPYISRSTGNPTTNEKALKRLAGAGARGDKETEKAASIILDIRGKSKMKGTYYDMEFHDDGRLRSSLNPIGTTTGRISSSQDIFGKGGNIQNLPYEFREYILPDDGYCMYEIDLGQAENRVVGYAAPSPRMIEAFENNRDIHSQTAAFMFDIGIETVKKYSKRLKEGDDDPKLTPDIGQGEKSYRAWGKQANHAFNYDMGYKKAALNWEIPEKEAKWIYNEYHRIYPGVQEMHSWIDDELNEDRTVDNILGRSRKFLGRWNQIKKDAYSYVAQSTVADIINRYGVCGIYYDQERFGDIPILSQVHDSVWIQMPLSKGWSWHAEKIEEICELMEPELSARGGDFIIPAEVTMLPNHAAYGHEFEGRPKATDLVKTYYDLTGEKLLV